MYHNAARRDCRDQVVLNVLGLASSPPPVDVRETIVQATIFLLVFLPLFVIRQRFLNQGRRTPRQPMKSNNLPRRSSGRFWVSIAALAMSFFACDSRWFEMQRARQAAAQQAKPSELHASEDGTSPAGHRLARKVDLRVYVSPRYATELVEWRNQFDAMIDDANRLLEPSLHVRLVIQDVRTWKPAEGDPDLNKALTELATLDPAPDKVWVIGLVGSVPRAAISIHELGVANIWGKHMVLRTMNDAQEYDSIQQHLLGVDEQERRTIYRQRKRHKTTAVFLHEFAHTLGVPHELAQKTMMNPTYDAKVEGFGDEVLGAMRISLDHRIGAEPSPEPAFTQALAGYLEQTSATWVPSDRDDLLRQLRVSGSAAKAETSTGEVKAVDVAIAGLSEADQKVFAEARNDHRNKRWADAFQKAQPLFLRYPDVYEVYELRCQIAMDRGGAYQHVEKECARLTQFTDEMVEGANKK